MIEIDPENQKIFFFYTPEEAKGNSKFNDKMYDFNLLSGHVCPDCGKVIDAYYIGTLPIGEASGTWQKHPYVPTLNNYCVSDPHYKFGHEYGGGYLIMCNHNETYCKTHIASVGGIIEGIKSVISYIIPTPEIIPSDSMMKTFSADIFENKVPGVYFIEDVCNQRSPILTINTKIFAENISYNGFSDFDKEYKWNFLFYKLIIGDPDIKITHVVDNQEPVMI